MTNEQIKELIEKSKAQNPSLYDKVKRALELQQQMSDLNKALKEAKAEYQSIMSDPYIYDKVEGLKQGGII